MNWNFSPNHGLHKICKILLKRKTTSTQKLSVKQNPERISPQQLQKL